MARATPDQAKRDDEDVADELDFQARFPANAVAASGGGGSMIESVSGGGEDMTPNRFMEWFKQDTTQAKIGGIMEGMGAIFTGLAGIPLGGGDMSSMERAGIRAAQAPENARRRLQQYRFTEYIDKQLASEKDPDRRNTLMAARAYPEQAAQYLAMESPGSKEGRETRIAEIEHGYRMEELELMNEGRVNAAGLRGGVTATRLDEIESANAWFRSLEPDVQQSAREGDMVDLIFDPSAMKFMPFLYSPSGGLLYNGQGTGTAPNIDLTGDVEVTDPDTGEVAVIDKVRMVRQWLAENYENLTPYARDFYEAALLRAQGAPEPESQPEETDEMRAVRKKLGLPDPN